MTVLEADLAIHNLADDHIVIELHQQLTAPGPALELHVVIDSETDRTSAWWEDEEGNWLREAQVGGA
jgi:hypothetical protein